jgi:hypothetical protein
VPVTDTLLPILSNWIEGHDDEQGLAFPGSSTGPELFSLADCAAVSVDLRYPKVVNLPPRSPPLKTSDRNNGGTMRGMPPNTSI